MLSTSQRCSSCALLFFAYQVAPSGTQCLDAQIIAAWNYVHGWTTWALDGAHVFSLPERDSQSPPRLISASVGSMVHYGFGCHTNVGKSFLGLCLATGLAGNVFPFMAWFNKHEYRVRLILSSHQTAIYVGRAVLSHWLLPRAGVFERRAYGRTVDAAFAAGNVQLCRCVGLLRAAVFACSSELCSLRVYCRPCRSIPPVVHHRARILRGPLSRMHYP